MEKQFKKLPEHFDLNCEFFHDLNFDTSYTFLKQEYDAKLWIRELVLGA